MFGSRIISPSILEGSRFNIWSRGGQKEKGEGELDWGHFLSHIYFFYHPPREIFKSHFKPNKSLRE